MNKKHARIPALTLSKQTIRKLTDIDLTTVAGGFPDISNLAGACPTHKCKITG